MTLCPDCGEETPTINELMTHTIEHLDATMAAAGRGEPRPEAA